MNDSHESYVYHMRTFYTGLQIRHLIYCGFLQHVDAFATHEASMCNKVWKDLHIWKQLMYLGMI